MWARFWEYNEEVKTEGRTSSTQSFNQNAELIGFE